MKLLFIICVFWVTALIEGVPNDYEQWLQPRGLGDWPFISWIYGGDTEDVHEENEAPSSPQRHTDESKPDELEPAKKDITNQYLVKVESDDKARSNDKPGSIEIALRELEEEINDSYKWESEEINDDKNDKGTRVIPVDKAGPNDKPEPIENLLADLKKKVNETNEEEKKDISALLTDLTKTMKDTSTNLAKVFINKAWHIFDIGTLGTTRRTRNTNDAITILTPLYALIGLLSQLLNGLHLGGGNNLLSATHGGNNIQGGGLFELLFPFYSNSGLGSSVNQQIVGGIAGLPGGQNHNSKNVYIIHIDDNNKAKAKHRFHGKTPDDVLLKIKESLDKDKLDAEEKLFIILRLHEMFDRFSDLNDDTALKIIKLIILIGEDPRFQQLFKIIKTKKNPEFDSVWNLFNHKPKLNEKYIKIIRKLPHGKIKEHPSRDCFIVGPDDEIIKEGGKNDDDNNSDDENTRSKNKKPVDLETFLMKIATRDINSKKDYYICCIDDDDESKANRILDGKTNDEVIDKIKTKLDRDDLSTEYKWYIILRLYKMLKDIEKDDRKDDKDKDKHEKDKNEKDKIIKLIIMIGDNPKFDPLLKKIKVVTKKDPRFHEIWKLLKNEPREPKEDNKLPEKDEDHKPDPKNPPDTTQPKEAIAVEDEKIPEKSAPIAAAVVPPPQVHVTQKIADLNLPDISKIDLTNWESKYDPVLKEIVKKMNDPDLDNDSRWNIIDFIDRWYLTKFADPRVKSKVDGLVDVIKQDPKYNETFDKIKRDNTPAVTKRVFDIFGKEYIDPSIQYYRETKVYRYPLHSSDSGAAKPESTPPSPSIHTTSSFSPFSISDWAHSYNFKESKKEDDHAKLKLVDKVDTLITLFTLTDTPHLGGRQDIIAEIHRKQLSENIEKILNDNKEEFSDFDNLFLSHIPTGDTNVFLISMLRAFKDYLFAKDYWASGKVYSREEERMKMQDFIYEQKQKGVIPK